MFVITISCLLLFAAYVVLIVWYRWAWARIPVYTPAGTGAGTKITVLVPARNEESNIGNCLISLSRQSYPKELYEVIVIDDFSTDATASIVKEFANRSIAGPVPAFSAAPGTEPAAKPFTEPSGPVPFSVTYLNLADHTSPETGNGPAKAYKKFAITTGIHAASGDLIVTTDADCWFHPDWLTTLADFYGSTGAKFIAAPVRIGHAADLPSDVRTRIDAGAGPAAARRSFLLIFQTLDFVTLQGITAAAVHRKFHSMCNGANLAYEKQAFREVDGFRDIDAIPSGDDMFLMHKIYKRYPDKVFFLKAKQAIVSTRPENSWKGFVNQRIRWASKADRYDDKRIFWVLLLVYLVNLMFLLLLGASFLNSWYGGVLLTLLIGKIFLEYPFVRSITSFFGQRRLMSYFPALQPFHICYTVIIGWLGKFGSYQWKQRKISA